MDSLVSVCIPTYNGAKYLPEALDSIIQQTYKNLEIVFSDDESTDYTLSIIEEFKNSVDFPVRVVTHSPSGIGSNWNNCLKNAEGEFIKFLFQDDILYPECIEEMIEAITQQKDIVLVASKRKFLIEGKINPSIRKWMKTYNDLQEELDLPCREINILDKTLFKNENFLQIPHNKIGEPSVVLFRRSILKKIGYFREDLEQILDAEFYYRVLKKYKIGIINKELAAFRLHPEQTTNINRKKAISDYRNYDKILYCDFFWYLSFKEQKRLFFKFNLIGKFIRKFRHAATGKR